MLAVKMPDRIRLRPRSAPRSPRTLSLGAGLLALLAAGCANHPAAVSSRPAPVGAAVPGAGARPAPPAPVPAADETVPNIRYGALRSEVLAAYPSADCTPEHCTAPVSLFGMPATFLIFAQPDGRWVANIAITDSTAAARAFAQANAAMRERYLSPSEVEGGGSLLRWRFDNIGTRQAVLRRCTADQKCRGAPHTVVEVDYFYKGGPLAQPW